MLVPEPETLDFKNNLQIVEKQLGLKDSEKYHEILSKLNDSNEPTKREFREIASYLLESTQISDVSVIANDLTNSFFKLATRFLEDGSCKWKEPIIPCFWSNLWMEQKGAEQQWKDVTEHCETITSPDSNELAKSQFIHMLYNIGGVALQENVEMEFVKNVRHLRDSFFLNDKVSRSSASQWVAKVMSHIYASTVLHTYSQTGVAGNGMSGCPPLNQTTPTQTICLVLDDFRRGDKKDSGTVLTSLEIKNLMGKKSFTTVEWKKIKEYAGNEHPISLYIVAHRPTGYRTASNGAPGHDPMVIIMEGVFDALGIKPSAESDLWDGTAGDQNNIFVKFVKCESRSLADCYCSKPVRQAGRRQAGRRSAGDRYVKTGGKLKKKHKRYSRNKAKRVARRRNKTRGRRKNDRKASLRKKKLQGITFKN
tara:strand:+ start:25401 stop:26669 length:1269 start_codon:yes stop_codon:yes gene_type:complete